MPSLLKKRWVLLNPGPVNVAHKVRGALLGPDLCHREPEFERLLKSIRRKLLHIFGIAKTHEAAILTGSGTLAVEAMLTSYAGPKRKVLVLSNGVYGERLEEILKSRSLPSVSLKSSLGSFPSLEAIETALKKDKSIEAVAMVHHETSNGMLNPLESVGRLAKKYRKVFLVDAVSSLGAEAIGFKNIDFLAASSGKCLHAYPGAAVVLVSIKESRRLVRTGVYTDLSLYLGNEPPFTPAIQLFYAFDAALSELSKEGLDRRIRNYAKKSALLQKGLKDLGISFLVPEGSRSHVLTSAWLPEGTSYENLHSRLKKKGFVIYAGQSSLKNRIFRVSNLGEVSESDLRRLLKELRGMIGPRPKRPKAIVLAAGVGKRFGARTKILPKCLIPLDDQGNCLLKRYLVTFKAAGVRDVVVVVGHEKEKIKKACRRWAKGLRVRFVHNRDYRRGSILSLHRAAAHLKNAVLVMDADVFFPTEALERLLARRKSAFLMDPRSQSRGEEMMLMAKNGRPWHIAKKLQTGLKPLGEATGIVFFDKAAAGALKKILADFYRRNDLDREYEDAYGVLLKQKTVGTVTMEGLEWTEVDFEEDLKKVQAFAVSQALR